MQIFEMYVLSYHRTISKLDRKGGGKQVYNALILRPDFEIINHNSFTVNHHYHSHSLPPPTLLFQPKPPNKNPILQHVLQGHPLLLRPQRRHCWPHRLPSRATRG